MDGVGLGIDGYDRLMLFGAAQTGEHLQLPLAEAYAAVEHHPLVGRIIADVVAGHQPLHAGGIFGQRTFCDRLSRAVIGRRRFVRPGSQPAHRASNEKTHCADNPWQSQSLHGASSQKTVKNSAQQDKINRLSIVKILARAIFVQPTTSCDRDANRNQAAAMDRPGIVRTRPTTHIMATTPMLKPTRQPDELAFCGPGGPWNSARSGSGFAKHTAPIPTSAAGSPGDGIWTNGGCGRLLVGSRAASPLLWALPEGLELEPTLWLVKQLSKPAHGTQNRRSPSDGRCRLAGGCQTARIDAALAMQCLAWCHNLLQAARGFVAAPLVVAPESASGASVAQVWNLADPLASVLLSGELPLALAIGSANWRNAMR